MCCSSFILEAPSFDDRMCGGFEMWEDDRFFVFFFFSFAEKIDYFIFPQCFTSSDLAGCVTLHRSSSVGP